MKTNEQIAAEGFETFSRVMKKAAGQMGVTYTETDKDEEQFSFKLDGHCFTLTWGEVPCQTWGKDYRVNYQLSIWYTTPGTWHSPPESVDTVLCDFGNVWPCVDKAFEVVFKEKVKRVYIVTGKQIGRAHV